MAARPRILYENTTARTLHSKYVYIQAREGEARYEMSGVVNVTNGSITFGRDAEYRFDGWFAMYQPSSFAAGPEVLRQGVLKLGGSRIICARSIYVGRVSRKLLHKSSEIGPARKCDHAQSRWIPARIMREN